MPARLIPIDDTNHPAVAPYLNIRDAHLKASTHIAPGGVFVAEGLVVIRTLLQSDLPTRSILTTPTRLQAIQTDLDTSPDIIDVLVAPQTLMNDIAGFDIHRGLLATGIRPTPPESDTQAITELAERPGPLVLLERLMNHDNVGGIFRSAAAFGAAGVILSPDCADPFYRKSLRVSVGHALTTPSIAVSDWQATISALNALGRPVVALALSPDAIDLAQIPAFLRTNGLEPSQSAILIGSEGPGLDSQSINAAYATARIPIASHVDSLNAGVAAAIALHAVSTYPAS